MTPRSLRIATRGSRLAQAQATWVADELRRRHPGLHVEIRIVRTQGDKQIDAPLAQIAGKGAFTREIEHSLLHDEADLAVHSLKDLPTAQPDGLRLGAVSRREDPRDVLVSSRAVDWRFAENGVTLGTSSLRRQAQILHINPNLHILPVRGNVPTRIRKALEGEVDAVLLAQAGIHRLELHPPHIETLEFDEMLPAPGQGALGLQIRADDVWTAERVGALNDPATEIACRAERAFLHALGGGCRVPIAALGTVEGDRLILDGLVSSTDGRRFFRDRIEGPAAEPESLGETLAGRVSKRGARKVLEEFAQETEMERLDLPAPAKARSVEDPDAIRLDLARETQESEDATETPGPEWGPLEGKLIVVTRNEDVDGPLSRALLATGADVICLPLIKHLPPVNPEPLRQAARDLQTFDWIVFTSARGVDAFNETITAEGQSLASYTGKIACVGPSTAQRVEAIGGQVAVLPADARGEALAAEFNKVVRRGLIRPGSQVLFPRADRGGTDVIEGLLELGAIVHDVEAYRTVTYHHAARQLRQRLASGTCDVVTFASGSAAEAFLEILGTEQVKKHAKTLTLASIGPSTSAPLKEHGIKPRVEASTHTFTGLAGAIVRHFTRNPKWKSKK